MATSTAFDQFVWVNSGILEGHPLAALWVAPGRVVLNAPRDLLLDPPADLEVVILLAGELVGGHVLRISVLLDTVERKDDPEFEPGVRALAVLYFEPFGDPPAGDVFETLVVAYAGRQPEYTERIDTPEPPEAFRMFRRPDVGEVAVVRDLREVKALAGWSPFCWLVPSKW